MLVALFNFSAVCQHCWYLADVFITSLPPSESEQVRSYSFAKPDVLQKSTEGFCRGLRGGRGVRH